MKLLKAFTGATLAILSSVSFSSCSNENDFSADFSKNGSLILQAPKIVAYSGNTYWNPFGSSTETRASNTEANRWHENWDCFPTTEDLTEEDINEIIRRLSIGEEIENTITLPFENYWVQQVYKGTDYYIPTDKFGDLCNQKILGSGQMDHLEDLDKNGVSERIENFEQGTNHSNPGSCQVCGKSLAGTTLKVDMKTENLDPTGQFFYLESYGSARYSNYYIIEYKGYYYLGFDYEMHKDANNPGEVKDVERDYNFTDWIVRIVPAYKLNTTPGPDENPGGIQEGDWYNEENGGDTPGEEKPSTPSTPSNPGKGDKHNNEVEVNLSVDDKSGKYNESHLSLHVRAATNVDLFIPMPLNMVCPADDMEIVQKHLEGAFVHGGTFENETVDKNGQVVMRGGLLSMVEYTISEWTVKLYVEYVAEGTQSAHGETFTTAGIHIWTDGICEGLMEYLQKNYGDGITFEIWNYYSEDSTLEQLKEYLDQAVISFLDFDPDYYINAFGEKNYNEGNDCSVNLEEETSSDYDFVGEGAHLNGSSHNKIYKKKAPSSED